MRLTFTTTCHNRLHHLRETYPKNFETTSRYSCVRFVLLDYGSTDGLLNWVLDSMYDHLTSGRLTYFSTDTEHFNAPHAKNVASLCAEPGVVCNLDADNFIHKDLVAPMMNEFSKSSRVVCHGWRSAAGRVAIMQHELIRVGGYDETFGDGYGYDDVDLVARVVRLGAFKRVQMPEMDDYLDHSDEERVQFMQIKSKEESTKRNHARMEENIRNKRLVVNPNGWGSCLLRKNMSEVLTVGVSNGLLHSR